MPIKDTKCSSKKELLFEEMQRIGDDFGDTKIGNYTWFELKKFTMDPEFWDF